MTRSISMLLAAQLQQAEADDHIAQVRLRAASERVRSGAVDALAHYDGCASIAAAARLRRLELEQLVADISSETDRG